MKKTMIELFEQCDQSLKDLVFTHSSYAHQHSLQSNERIEFLGDSVLSTIVSDYLYKHCHEQEGKMSKIRAKFVCTENLSDLARELKIESRIKFGKSFKDTVSNAILADTVECMIGAMYLSYGLHSISTAVLDALKVKERLKQGMKPEDHKSLLQEYAQAKKLKLTYTVEKYLTKGGQENFRASSFIDGEFVSYGQGSSKREAEQNSAKLALKKLKKKEK